MENCFLNRGGRGFIGSADISGGDKLYEYLIIRNRKMIIYIFYNIPLQPRRLLLFCWQKSKQKTMSAESASLKIGYTSLKIRNLSSFHFAFKQTDFLRFVLPIFLTLTSQGGNQGIAKGDE